MSWAHLHCQSAGRMHSGSRSLGSSSCLSAPNKVATRASSGNEKFALCDAILRPSCSSIRRFDDSTAGWHPEGASRLAAVLPSSYRVEKRLTKHFNTPRHTLGHHDAFYGALKHALSPPGAVAEGGSVASLPQEDADKQPAGQTERPIERRTR